MKRQFFEACCVVMMLSGWAMADFGGGSGTADDPYLIYNKEELLSWIMLEGWARQMHVKLMADIDFEGERCPTLCNSQGFRGVIDGNNKSIKNIYMENQSGFIRPSSSRACTLKNLTLVNPVLVVTEDGLDVGILAGNSNSQMTVENCHVVDAVIEAPLTKPDLGRSIEGVNVGGLVYYNQKKIINSSFSGVASGWNVGGLAYYNCDGAAIENCHASVEIYSGRSAGGIASSNSGLVRNCYTSGTLDSENADWAYVGGLVGYNNGVYSTHYDGNGQGDGNGLIVDCHSSCDVSGEGKAIGGLVGTCWGGAICLCYATGSVSGYSYLGGLVGTVQTSASYAYMGVIENCYSTGSVSGHDRIGGLSGENGSAIIRNCYSFGSATGTDTVGGLVGCIYFYPYNGYGTAIIDKCYSVGKVTGSQLTGGLVGFEWNGTQVVTNSFWDKQTSGWTTSVKGTGKATSEMKTLSTFTDAGWDFVGESDNGEEDIWLMEDANYPILSWQFVNTAPVADAGCDQTAYAEPNGFAHVVLDANDSYDADGDELSYSWVWEIGAEIFEANGLRPVICLPVGEHTIELVVNDGTEDSEPNYVAVTVIEPLGAYVRVFPEVLNRQAEGPKGVMAVVYLGEQREAGQFDVGEGLTLYPGGVGSVSCSVVERPRGEYKGVSIAASFARDEVLEAIAENGDMEIEIVGHLNTGEWFSGTDVLQIK